MIHFPILQEKISKERPDSIVDEAAMVLWDMAVLGTIESFKDAWVFGVFDCGLGIGPKLGLLNLSLVSGCGLGGPEMPTLFCSPLNILKGYLQ